MKQAQVTEMLTTAAKIERDVQSGRWEESVSDEEVRHYLRYDAFDAKL